MSHTVVITGASRGIGAGLAQDFAQWGLRLGLCARSECPLPAGAEAGSVVRAALDVTDAEAVSAFADQVVSALGPIDLWINNAGVLEPIRPLRAVEAEEMRRHLDVNVVGVLNGTRAFAQHVRGRDGGGVLVNISSGAGRHPYEGWGAYCAGKAAVDRLTEVVALEEAEAGLSAYAVAPGVVDTDMQELIRQTDQADFPLVEQFREMKREGAFSTLAQVSEGLYELAFGAGSVSEVLIDLRR